VSRLAGALERRMHADPESRGPLSYPAFRRAAAGRAIGTAGSWMQVVAAGWLVYQLTNSAAAVGLLTVLSRGPGLLLNSYGGMLADRMDRRRLTAGLYVVQLLCAALLAALAWDGSVSTEVLYAVTGVMGCAFALSNPALLVAANATVPRSLNRRATSMNALGVSLARIVGPSVGGVLLEAIGPGVCFLANGVGYAIVIAAMLSLPPASQKPTGGVKGSLRDALRIVRRRPAVLGMLIGAAAFALLAAPIQELAAPIADRVDEGGHILGFMLGALAVGGIFGSLLVRQFDRASFARYRLLGAAMAGCGIATAPLALETSFAVDLVALWFCGLFWQIAYVETLAGVQLGAPHEEAGRVVGMYFTVLVGGLMLGALLMGVVFDELGIDVGLLIVGGALFVTGVVRMLSPVLAGPYGKE
jgi:predicted MFS family arabinose efflux permease